MSDRPSINSIPVLEDEILEGMVRVHAEELRINQSPDRLLARNFIMKAFRHVAKQLHLSRMRETHLRDSLEILVRTVPCVFLPDDAVSVDDVSDWLSHSQISGWSFVSHNGINHFIFASWDDAALCKLRWG